MPVAAFTGYNNGGANGGGGGTKRGSNFSIAQLMTFVIIKQTITTLFLNMFSSKTENRMGNKIRNDLAMYEREWLQTPKKWFNFN